MGTTWSYSMLTSMYIINDINDMNDINDINDINTPSTKCDKEVQTLSLEMACAHQYIYEMFKEIDGNTPQEKLNTLANCNCCDRHKKNKPIIFQYWRDIEHTNSNQEMNILDCGCDCRHSARMICRKCPI